MKNKKSTLIAIPLLLAMLFVSLAPFVVPAKAEPTNLPLVYYFSDYYPTLDKATLEQEFPDYQVVYHHQWATEATLYNAVMQGVPAGVSFHTVIIDIKSFKPSGATMSAIFSYFASQGCRTVFVSQYDAGDFDNSAFFSLVDRYCQSNLSTLYAFVYWALNLMYDHNGGTLSDTTILIDGRLIDPSYSGSQPFDDRFPFYDVLKQMLSHPNFNSPTNVHLLVHTGSSSLGYSFYDVSPDSSLGTFTVSDITDFTDAQENRIWEYICAIGFAGLESDFYNFIENNRGSFDEMPLYLFEVEPVAYGEEGLEAMVFSTEDAMGMVSDEAFTGLFEVPETDLLLITLASILT